MPIPGQPALVSILQAKEQTLTFQPLALVQLQLVNSAADWAATGGSMGSPTALIPGQLGPNYLYFSSENNDGSMGGFPYTFPASYALAPGQKRTNDYQPRILKQSMGALQSVSDTGFIQMPSVSIVLADADRNIWLNVECPPGPGINGAKLTVFFVFWDPDTNTYSQDLMVKFVGICNAPPTDDETTTLTAINILNLQNLNLPTAQCSQTCIWSFPPDKPSRIAACSDPQSVYWPCHYSPDVTDADFPNSTPPPAYTGPRGNLINGAPTTTCDYTKGNPPANGAPATGCLLRMGNPSSSVTNGFSVTFFQTGEYTNLEKDTSGRRTGTFGGITFNPPYDWRGKGYVSGIMNQNINDPNDAKYSGYYSQQWGAGFCTPLVMNVEGGSNITSFECVLFAGAFQGLLAGSLSDGIEDRGAYYAAGTATPAALAAAASMILVVVNDITVPFYPASTDPSIINWQWVNDGGVFGLSNRAALFNGKGDPYGSMVALCITVPVEVLGSNSLPTVQIIWTGAPIAAYTSPTAAPTIAPTENPVWAVYDMLTTYAGLPTQTQVLNNGVVPGIDIVSFINAASVCDTMITYDDITGNSTATHARYRLGFAAQRRRSMQEIMNNILASFKAQLAQSAGIDPTTTGQMQIFIKQSLADQQSEPVVGSNYNVPYPSPTADANTDENNQPVINSQGYFAYLFDDTNIARQSSTDRDSPTTFKLEQRTIQDSPDRIAITFQDEEDQYTQDSLAVVDTQKYNRNNSQIVNGPTGTEGIVNYDQAQRIIQTQFAEAFRGNPRSGLWTAYEATAGLSGTNNVPQDDAGGTWIVSFETSIKAIHLRVGHIIAITQASYGLNLQPFRIYAISPQMNFERIMIRAQWHEDDWYMDSYGQQPYPYLQAQNAQRTARPPYAWLPNYTVPLSSDPLMSITDHQFALAQTYTAAADKTALAALAITGYKPVNDVQTVSNPPYAPVLVAEPTGGTFPDGYYYAAVVAVDINGKTTAPSNPTNVALIYGGTDHGSLVVPDIYWQPGTVGWKVYASHNPNNLSLQLSGSGTPTNITIENYIEAGEGLPDLMFNNLEVRITPISHSGIFGTGIISVTSTTMTIDTDVGFDMTGRVVSILGLYNTSANQPIWDFYVTGYAVVGGASVLTVGAPPGGSAPPDLTTLVPSLVNAVVVGRTQPDIISATTIGDSKFINGVDYYAPPIVIVDATNASPIVIETNVNHEYANGDEVLIQGVTGNVAANGYSIVIVIDATHFSLTGTHGSGSYNGGGTSTEITNGMTIDGEIGNFVYIEYGTGAGQWRKITTNTQTTVTIDNEWAIMPDSTSVFIVVKPNYVISVDTTGGILISTPAIPTTISVPVPNYLGQVVWCQVFTQSASPSKGIAGTYSVISDSPGREIYIYGGPGTAVVQYDKATFNIAVSTDFQVADDVCVPYIVRRPGSPIDCISLSQVPSVGADIQFDVILTKQNGSYTGTIFASEPGITIPAGSTSTVDQQVFKSGIHFDQGDLLTIDCLQVGSTQPGQGGVIVIKFKLD